jgi:Cytochrome P450
MIGTISHNLHRLRRGPLNKLFSKASVTKLEPLIQTTVDKLCNRLREFQDARKPVTISLAYTCCTNDVVSEYAFAKSYNYIENSPDFRTDIHDAMENVSEVSHILKQVPWLVSALQKIPAEVMKFIDPKIASFLIFQRVCLANRFLILN